MKKQKVTPRAVAGLIAQNCQALDTLTTARLVAASGCTEREAAQVLEHEHQRRARQMRAA